MLSNLLAEAHNMVHKATDAAQDIDFFNKIFHKNAMNDDLVSGDSAQWAAGLLYAYTSQNVDARDYIVSCSQPNDRLDSKLEKAFEYYNADNNTSGNQNIRDTEPYYRRSMMMCDETNHYFEDMASKAHDFFAQDDWRDTVHTNYEANKAQIDQQWDYCLLKWNQGVYFDAGMFYGRVWYLLAYNQPI